ncbi:MAG: C39 family peptidase [Patescibacteria group bacterium]
MKKNILTLLLLVALLAPEFAANAQTEPQTVNLNVPFTSEAPDGLMVGNWKNACEEASIVMIEQFYAGNTTTKLPTTQAKNLMNRYFGIANKIFGGNANENAKQIAQLMNQYSTSSAATIVQNPTLDQIKDELNTGRPVIALIYGKGLNPRIDFLVGGSYYHTFVIVGYDNNTNEFIVNDVGDLRQGLDLRYKYDIVLGALHDYNHTTKRTDGPPTVIFTSQRILAKAKGSNRIYLISNNTRQYITAPSVFKTRGWKWSLVQTVDKNWLNSFPAGTAVTQ